MRKRLSFTVFSYAASILSGASGQKPLISCCWTVLVPNKRQKNLKETNTRSRSENYISD